MNKTMSTGAPCDAKHRRIIAEFTAVTPQEIRPRIDGRSIRTQITPDVLGAERFQCFPSFDGHHHLVAADGNELHPLGGAGQGCLGAHRVQTGRRPGLAADLDDASEHRFKFLVARLRAVGRAHAGSQIDRSDENRIDTRQAVNCLRIVDALRTFGLQHDQDFVVCPMVILLRRGLKVDRVHPAAAAAVALGRILGRGNGRLRLLHRVDHRHDNTPRPRVERPLDEVMVALGHANERHATGVGDRPDQRGRLAPIDRLMLHVDREPIEPTASEHAGGQQIAKREPGAKRRLAIAKLLFHGIGFHRKSVLNRRLVSQQCSTRPRPTQAFGGLRGAVVMCVWKPDTDTRVFPAHLEQSTAIPRPPMTDASPPPADGTPQPDLAGRRLGDYQLLRRLGRGAMADVYLAEQISLRRQVAFKVLRSDLAGDGSYVQRFHHEAMAAASLVHANIVQIHEVGQAGGVHFIAQEYVAGQNLGELIRRSGPVDVKLAVAVMRQVAAALVKAAEQGIVHRDIKPENIMLARTGEVKVADFGLARVLGPEGVDLTQIGITMGTPLYMSPEQIEGQRLDPRSDIYSLGVTCYHMLSGRPPYTGDTSLAVAVQHLNSPAARLETLRPDLPSGLARIVHKMLNKKPEDRYKGARELLQDLRVLMAENADEDWSEGLAEWSPAETIALAGAPGDATAQLDRMMKTSAMLVTRRLRLGRLAAGVVVCLVLGAVVASISRPESLLLRAQPAPIPQRATVWGQLYHAKTTDTELAWLAVEQSFPAGDSPENQLAAYLAKQGLVRHYMAGASPSNPSPYAKALSLLDELAELGETEVSFRAFGLAGKCVVLHLLGRTSEAMASYAQMDPEMIDTLPPRMRQMLGDVVSR